MIYLGIIKQVLSTGFFDQLADLDLLPCLHASCRNARVLVGGWIELRRWTPAAGTLILAAQVGS